MSSVLDSRTADWLGTSSRTCVLFGPPVVLHDGDDAVVQEEGERQQAAQRRQRRLHQRHVQRGIDVDELDVPAPLAGLDQHEGHHVEHRHRPWNSKRTQKSHHIARNYHYLLSKTMVDIRGERIAKSSVMISKITSPWL